MFRNTLIPMVIICVMGALGAVHAQAADPSSQQIYAVARTGNLGQAEQMIEQVLRDHPASGKAHYVAAEIYARARDMSRARAELDRAESLSPGLPFAAPSAVAALQRELTGARTMGGAPRHSLSWGALLAIGAIVIIIFTLLRRRRVVPYGPYAGQPGAYPGAGPYAGQYPPVTPYGPAGLGARGPGIMSTLASGLALGAGVAAGEEVVQHMLNRGGVAGFVPPADAGEAPANADMGGADFGLTDNSGSWDGGSAGGDWGGGDMGGGDWT